MVTILSGSFIHFLFKYYFSDHSLPNSLKCDTKLKSTTVFIEVHWVGGRDFPMTQTASRMLTRPAGARLEHRVPSGSGRRSVVGDGRQVGLPGRESREMV